MTLNDSQKWNAVSEQTHAEFYVMTRTIYSMYKSKPHYLISLNEWAVIKCCTILKSIPTDDIYILNGLGKVGQLRILKSL